MSIACDVHLCRNFYSDDDDDINDDNLYNNYYNAYNYDIACPK